MILTANYSYKHARLFSYSAPATPSRPTSTVAYATVYFSLSDRIGLTGAIGRTFPSKSDSGGFTRFASFGIGFALTRGHTENTQKSEAAQANTQKSEAAPAGPPKSESAPASPQKPEAAPASPAGPDEPSRPRRAKAVEGTPQR